MNKSDLMVNVGPRGPFRVSIKKGHGNSVHQEPLEDFMAYINGNLGAGERICNDIRLFIWGDGTLDGTGRFGDRMNVSQLKREIPGSISRIRDFFEDHKNELVRRFLIEGLKSLREPDVVYYGTPSSGLWAWFDEVIEFLCEPENRASRATIPVGGLTFQAWGRATNNEGASDRNRGVVQSKWPGLENHLLEIMERRG